MLLALCACAPESGSNAAQIQPESQQEGQAQPAPSSGKGVEAQLAPKAEARVVKLGFQKIGPPFLLKARSAELDAALAAKQTRATWIEFATGPALLEAMRAGEVDIGYVGETPPVFAQAGGVPFVYVATDPPAPKAEAIVVKKDSPIRTVAQLKGKKVALNRGSNVHYLFLRALEEAKLSLSDVELLYLAPADARSAFETGSVDAWVIWDPFQAAAELGGARVLRDGTGLVDNHLFYVVRRDFAQSQAELVALVLDQYSKLSTWAGSHAEDAARLLADSSGVAYDALLLAERRHPYGLQPITPEILQKQQAIADAFHKLEVIPRDIDTSEAFLSAVVYKAGP